MRPRLLSFVLTLLAACPALAGELRVYPPEVTIAGPNRAQQLLVVEEENGRVVADHTATAKYTTPTPSIATVSPTGLVAASGTGESTVSASVGGQAVSVKVTASRPGTGWNFRNHVLPTLTRTGCNSGACHGALAGKGGLKLSLRGYDPDADHFVLTRQALARRVDRTKPTDSLLLKKATRTIPHGGGSRFDDGTSHYQLLREWITAGAIGPTDAGPNLAKLAVYPHAALLKPGAKFRVIVRATYSDGTIEDVTRWAKFGSSEEQVATANEDGFVAVAGHGEAAITVNFGTRVATLPVTSPFPNTVDAALFTKAPRQTLVDEFVLKKLELLRLPPSAPCTDAEFIRRAYLDTCGILPKPNEVKAFLADTDTQKRAKLVDHLLDHPAFVDYWAFRWSDLLLVSSRKLPQSAMWAFYRSVRQGVADNEPWDVFARRIVTASGSTLTNGAGNFFVLHKDVSDLAESASVTFLGMSITCARCHNHPLEKWTQDEYWAFANLFARVGMKNGDKNGEVLIQARPDGDALHPRRGIPMQPKPLDGKPIPAESTVDRRAAFADWLTAPDNPYFARAFVNRVWKNYMGRGLVEAEDDLRQTNPATNPELLDALATDFVKHRFDVKHLMRTILNSAAYQRSSKPLPANLPDDRFYSRYLIRRLSAEVILDAYSDLTGSPTPFTQLKSAGGDAVTPTNSYPAGTRAVQLPDSLAESPFLEAFGRAERTQTCACERTADASVTQALHLNNGRTLNEKLRGGASVVAGWITAKLSDGEIVDRVYLAALSRAPSLQEQKTFVAILVAAAKEGPAAHREAIEDFVWAVLTGREFLFNH